MQERENIDHKATTSLLLSFHKVWRSSKTQILLVSTQIKSFFFNSSNIELDIYRCMKKYKVNFQYLMTKRFCKTYLKTIPKYIQVPPILNFLYGSFSTAWVIYLTVRRSFLLPHLYPHFQKKLSFHVSSIIFIHVSSTIGYASSQWSTLQLAW